MNKTAFALTSTTALILVMACQPKTKTKTEYVTVEVPKKDKVYEFTRESSGDPVEVQVYDPNCNDQRGLGLRSALIAEALIGVDMVRTSTTIEENIWENAKEKSITRQTYEMDYISQGRPVALCRDASTIPVNTQEGAAISMKSDADTAHALYQAVKNKGSLTLPTLEPIYLNAAIKVKMIDRSVNADDVAREDTEYQTDNAVFMGGTHPTLISYPQSKQSQQLKLLGGEPLWAIKGVFQHEFGHFIFSTMMNEGGASFLSYHEHAAAHPDLHLFQTPASTLARIASQPTQAASFGEFVKSQDFFIGSLNEGFADMWAYYSLKQPADMFDISCFAKNRNLVSPTFYNGISKSWDETLWNKTFSTKLSEELQEKPTSPIEACSQPFFSDIHIIGAAMAHTADAVFAAAVPTNPTQDSSVLKAEMALAWLKSIKASNEFDDLGGKASLSRIMNTAVGTSISYLKGADKTALCNVVTSKFPVLVKRWKDAKTDNEDVSGVVSFCSL